MEDGEWRMEDGEWWMEKLVGVCVCVSEEEDLVVVGWSSKKRMRLDRATEW